MDCAEIFEIWDLLSFDYLFGVNRRLVKFQCAQGQALVVHMPYLRACYFVTWTPNKTCCPVAPAWFSERDSELFTITETANV
jgi:hypothetical protein